MTTTRQTDQSNSARSGLHLWVAIALAAVLLISWLMGYGPGGSKCAPAQSMAARAAATVESLPATVPAPAPAPVIASAPAAAPAPEPAAAPASATAPPPVTAPAPVPEASAAPSLSSAVSVAKIYFGSEKANMPKGGARSLAGIVKYLKTHPGAKASVSGFHDPSGNLASNEALALRRAQAVAAALEKMGVRKDRIILQKPAQTTGTGKASEARRVEVGIVAS
jgi:outer membrane protein OmpA-like peptidoglycan-associated protein